MDKRMRCLYLTMTAAILVSGCVVPVTGGPPIEPISAASLQQPLPGQAVVYLIGVPHDRAEVTVTVGGVRKTVLPPASYAVLQLPAASYRIASTGNSEKGEAEAPAAEAELTVMAGERRFFYTSRASTTSSSLELIPLRGGFVPLFGQQSRVVGQRVWRECSELDALGMLSIAAPAAIQAKP
jgi:hypothetical protein